jgi:hypothetical protein
MNPFMIDEPLFYWFGGLFFVLLFTKAFLHYTLLTKESNMPKSVAEKILIFGKCLSVYPVVDSSQNSFARIINMVVVASWSMVGLMIYFGSRNISTW